MDDPRVGGILLDLLAEPENIDVDRPVGNCALLSPDGVQQLFTAKHDADPVHQKLQQPELGGGQGQQFTVEARLATAAVEFERRRP